LFGNAGGTLAPAGRIWAGGKHEFTKKSENVQREERIFAYYNIYEKINRIWLS
jgi:hypothetical protein